MEEKKCLCNGSSSLVFSCSGGADAGELADVAARKLKKEGLANMYCLTGIGGDVSGIIKTTKEAERLLAIDGCPVACAKKLLLKSGFNQFEHLELSELGFEKGKTVVTEEAVRTVTAEAVRRLS